MNTLQIVTERNVNLWSDSKSIPFIGFWLDLVIFRSIPSCFLLVSMINLNPLQNLLGEIFSINRFQIAWIWEIIGFRLGKFQLRINLESDYLNHVNYVITHPQAIRVVDEFVSSSYLEKCSIMSQWMLCSEWVPSEWESKQLIKTSQ